MSLLLKRFYASGVLFFCMLCATSCSFGADNSFIVNGQLSTYLPFEQYADLLTRCNYDEILQAFKKIKDPELPGIPIKEVRLCTSNYLVLGLQSMWADEEYIIVNVDNEHLFHLEAQSAGGYCALKDDCEILTIAECEENPDCTQFRLVILSDETGNELAHITFESDKLMSFTYSDLLLIAKEGSQGRIYLHLDNEFLTAKHGSSSELEIPSQMQVAGMFTMPIPADCSYFSDDVYGIQELRCKDVLPRLDMKYIESFDTTEDFEKIAISRAQDFCRHGNLNHQIYCTNPTQMETGTTLNNLRYVRFYLTLLEKQPSVPDIEKTVGPVYVVEFPNIVDSNKVTYVWLLPRSTVADGVSPLIAVSNIEKLQSMVDSIQPIKN